jgi:hypothetical protein
MSLIGRVGVVAVLAAAAAWLAAGEAFGSELIGLDASGVQLAVDRSGRAWVTFTSAGVRRSVVAGGAVDALQPSTGRRQLRFRISSAGATAPRSVCRPYAGPPLPWLLASCTAPDGSHWAVQAWQRRLPNYGVAPTGDTGAWELRLSHWRGLPASLSITVDWAYRRDHHLFGTLTYRGRGVHGFHSTRYGEPLDDYGRNVYVDTLDSAYGPGWRRENSFLAHGPYGTFCYGFYPHGGRPEGRGRRYRATVIGPGVSPDVGWEGVAPGAFDAAADKRLNQQQRALMRGDPKCHTG